MSQLPEVHLYFDNNINLKLFTCVKNELNICLNSSVSRANSVALPQQLSRPLPTQLAHHQT